jgi:hypothetical protein
VKRRKNSERPQNRNLRPWKKGAPDIPKSPGRPRTRDLLHEIERYVMEHPDSLDDYFGQPIAGKKRLHRLYDVMLERHTVQLCHLAFGKPQ